MRRVLVTRPQPQASRWVELLRRRGVDAVALPLLAIAAPADPAAVGAAWAGLGGRRLVVFVSPNAVERFFDARPAAAAWPDRVLAGAPGPGTAEALRRLGVPPTAIVEPPAESPSFDAKALWSALEARPWAGAGVLVVRGEGGRPWLGERLAEAGARVEHLAAYRRQAPVLDRGEAAHLDAALASPAACAWLFSSSAAIDHLEAVAGRGRWGASCAVATHEAIADRARAAAFAEVALTRPTLDAVVACIQSLRP